MKWALVDDSNIVQNIIIYDGKSNYTPPKGFSLRQIEDWIEIGLNADLPENQKPRPAIPDSTAVKEKRNLFYKYDLTMIGLFQLAKVANPQLTLSDYLDSLEVVRDTQP